MQIEVENKSNKLLEKEEEIGELKSELVSKRS
jgi:hypothetical protein